MKIAFGTVITAPDSSPLMMDGKPVTLSSACFGALIAENRDEKLTPEEKYKRYELGKKVNGKLEVLDLKVEEVATIQKCIGGYLTIWAYGQAKDLLEGVQETSPEA